MADDRSADALRTQRSVARKYRKRGYDVVEQPRGDSLPLFLRGFSPDLIATKDDDRAVVEIKTVESLRGSNEIKELAAAVEVHTGWRFELISLGTSREAAPGALSENILEQLLSAALAAFDSGQPDMSLIYLVSVLDELLRDAAVQHRIRGRDRSARSIIQELAFRGIIDGAAADVLDKAWDWRNAIVHVRSASENLHRDEIVRIIEACREVQAAMQLQAS